MHKYLRAVGFSNIQNRKQLMQLLGYSVKGAEEKSYTSNSDDTLFAEYNKSFGENIGLTVRGEYDEENCFSLDYYFPYCKGTQVSSTEDVSIERHAEKESYAGVCDDIKVGVSLIFYLQNIVNYIKLKNAGRLPIKGTTLSLSALSVKGMIVMPLNKNESDKKKVEKASFNRNKLIAAARMGDEEAIESLTLEDMDTYTIISRKILKEDVFSLVDTYFMPYGVECDHYSVLGEIIDISMTRNNLTKEEVISLTVNANDLIFDVAINRKDLLGEPAIGRRFKGFIWMQGFINFPS
ncbi:MAG: DUF3881 family protein [Lachnospiraceae bacterium]|nr:DUF3881 family protein [Lachnospiraceae bacterium]